MLGKTEAPAPASIWSQPGQGGRATGDDWTAPAVIDDPCLGFAFYAPPGAVPRARLFPTAPVSADAILLTAVGVDCAEDRGLLSQSLLAAVVNDLVRRGVRALEAFGYTSAVTEMADSGKLPEELSRVVAVLGDCSVDECMLTSDFLEDVGFTVVAPHPYFPRLRLELDKGLGWKAEVEAALERLLERAQMELPIGAGTSGARGRGRKALSRSRNSPLRHARSISRSADHPGTPWASTTSIRGPVTG